MAARRLCVTTLLFSLLHLSLSNPELTALLAFKSESDPSNSLSSWSSSTHPCSGSWLGVSCSNGRLTHLVLDRLNLTGSARALTRLPHLRLLSLNHNRLSSALNLSSWPNLKHLYLSDNRFAGEFPAGVSRLRRIRRLVLSRNNFSGEIPMSKLAQLPRLLTLRLEGNSFTGTLLSNSSSSIYDFNVSGNNLGGEIPAWMSEFPASSFAGNAMLCGGPLGYSCPDGPRETSERKKRVSDAVVLVIIIIDAVAGAGIILTVGWCCCMRRRKRVAGARGGTRGSDRTAGERGEMVMFDGCKGFTRVDDLLKASAELLGKGRVGSTYKVVVDGGGAVAVKRVRQGLKKGDIEGLMKEIGVLRHLNIVSLRAYYFSGEELLLVHDFLPNGSLHSLLHGNRGPGRTPLDWTTRLKLAAGAARGLAYLHGCNKSKLVHGHLTSSNIIVDASGNACITDAGLHHFLPRESGGQKGSGGRGRPSWSLSQKGDVYSFGVVLLELLTGKMAAGEGEESKLGKWAKKKQRGEWEVFDFELWRYKEMKEEMKWLLQIALRCLAPQGRDRPKMITVHNMIEEIRMKGSTDQLLLIKDGLIHSPHSSGYSSHSDSTTNFTSS